AAAVSGGSGDAGVGADGPEHRSASPRRDAVQQWFARAKVGNPAIDISGGAIPQVFKDAEHETRGKAIGLTASRITGVVRTAWGFQNCDSRKSHARTTVLACRATTLPYHRPFSTFPCPVTSTTLAASISKPGAH